MRFLIVLTALAIVNNVYSQSLRLGEVFTPPLVYFKYMDEDGHSAYLSCANLYDQNHKILKVDNSSGSVVYQIESKQYLQSKRNSHGVFSLGEFLCVYTTYKDKLTKELCGELLVFSKENGEKIKTKEVFRIPLKEKSIEEKFILLVSPSNNYALLGFNNVSHSGLTSNRYTYDFFILDDQLDVIAKKSENFKDGSVMNIRFSNIGDDGSVYHVIGNNLFYMTQLLVYNETDNFASSFKALPPDAAGFFHHIKAHALPDGRFLILFAEKSGYEESGFKGLKMIVADAFTKGFNEVYTIDFDQSLKARLGGEKNPDFKLSAEFADFKYHPNREEFFILVHSGGGCRDLSRTRMCFA